MAKSESTKPCETENIENTLDAVLITALQENFEIKSGCHVDRNEMLKFLRSVIDEHPELNFVLQHRDTKLSGRIYKAFPRVTTKRVAVPNIRGKKTWTYTNLRRITSRKDSQPEQDTHSDETPTKRSPKSDPKDVSDTTAETLIIPRPKQERKLFRSKRSVRSASMVHRDSLFETYKQERESAHRSKHNIGNVPQQSYLGKFNDMLKWMKDHYELDKNSSVQVKHIVERIKAEFKINITYKQSHKLIFAVFPGTTSRAQDPVKIEAQGGFYSYRGISPKQKREQEDDFVSELTESPPKSNDSQNDGKSINMRQTLIPPCGSPENGRKRVMRTRKRFIEACAVLKPAEVTIPSDIVPTTSDVPRRAPEVHGRRFSDLGPRYPDVSPMNSDMVTIERDNNWRRMIEELKQERDQAIVERNQAMVSLMEIEREQTTSARASDDLPQRTPTCSDVIPSGMRRPKSEERCRENPDWLRSLISRSNSILGEQMSEANAVYFPRSSLQNNYDQRYPKPARYTGEYLEIERYEQLKQERDAIWKSWMDKLRAEKDDVIQQLKFDKMEVIQRMELEKSDAVECVEEKLTNQITILTREMRELKELLNHTMNERTLAIDHAHKLIELIGEDKLKDSELETFPFDVTNDQVVHPPKQKTDETTIPKTLVCFGKGNKRKQSMPAKLKKFPRLDDSVSSESMTSFDIPGIGSQTVSNDSMNLLSDAESNDNVATDIGITDGRPSSDDRPTYDSQSTSYDRPTSDSQPTSDRPTTDGYPTSDGLPTSDSQPTFKSRPESANSGTCNIVVSTTDNTTSQSVSPNTDSEKISRETQTYPTPLKNCLASSDEIPSNAFPLNEQSNRDVSADEETALNVLDAWNSSTEIPEKLESSKAEDSNEDNSEKSANRLVASNSEKCTDLEAMAESIDSKNRIDNPRTVPSTTCSSSEKIAPEFPRSVNTSECKSPGKCSTIGTPSSVPSTTNSRKDLSETSANVACGLHSHSENFTVGNHHSIRTVTGDRKSHGNSERLAPTQKYLSETLGSPYSPFTINSGNYLRDGPRANPSSSSTNFRKFVSEIPKTFSRSPLNTEVQKFSPGIPRTVSASSESELATHENPRSFEESVTSTFLKYFSEVPKSSLNAPLARESSKYFRGTSRSVSSSVSSDSEKYVSDPGNQALVCPDEETFSEKSKVSSIDFLNSMVENIGKSSIE